MTKLYSQSHEWVEMDAVAATVGISLFARDQLGDIVFVELPTVGRTLAKGEAAAVVESVKAASEIYVPVSGEVVAVNEAVAADPSLIGRDPEGAGWLMKVRLSNVDELTELLDGAAYAQLAT